MNHRLLLTVTVVVLFGVALLAPLSGVAWPAAASPTAQQMSGQVGAAVGTAFTYQGQLQYHNAPATGLFDFEFRLYDATTGGVPIGSVVEREDISVTHGLFTVLLDFGVSAFTGQARWLEISVRPGAETGALSVLLPRQALTATPYALYAQSAASTGALQGYPVTTTAPLEGQALVWSSGAWSGSDVGVTDHGALTGLGDDDHPQYFNLDQDEVVSGTPAFNGGTSGATPPFSVDSTTLVPNLNADLLDGQDASTFQQHYANMIVVAKSGGDYTSVTAALDSITTASDANRYLIKVMPGVYTETVIMKQFVDIEGSGELTTRLTFTGSSDQYTGTVVGASNAELRFLTVANTGGNTYATAIFNNAASPRLTNVTARASGGAYQNFGVYNYTSSPTMTNVTASASGGTQPTGVYNENSSAPLMTDVTASASGGHLVIGVHNRNSSPLMTDVTASASGGTYQNMGVYNFECAPTMTDVTVSASGGTYAYGVYNDGSSLTMTDVTVSAEGGVYAAGMYNGASSATIYNSTIRASGGTTDNHGIRNHYTDGDTRIVNVNNSHVTGSTSTISNEDDGFITRVGATRLDGGSVIIYGGNITCAGVYDENYAFYASTCP